MMKFRKEPEARREEVETRNTQRRDLTDEELKQVAGGVVIGRDGYGQVMPDGSALNDLGVRGAGAKTNENDIN